ncbi:MAG: leucine-rich repeat protein [Clostridia bacterium]|nr:leucine-rich repeat protein [Clostridia bacterium]
MKKFKQKLVRTTAIFLTAVLLICAAPLNGIADTDWSEFTLTANALDASGSLWDNLTYTYNTFTRTLIISGTGSMEDYSSSSYHASPLYNQIIRSVVINDGVTSIGDYAFYGCTNLESITIPDSVTSIGDYAFYGCTNLTDVTIGDGVNNIGERTFYNCQRLASITIPEGVTDIGTLAFWGCTGLVNITLPGSITYIGSSAFYNTAYYKDINNWEDNVLYIDNYLISAEKSISGSYKIKPGTKLMAVSAFNGCDKLTDITITGEIPYVSINAFSACTSLERVVLEEGVKQIGTYSFSGCTSLKSIIIPDSVTDIFSGAFGYGNSLLSAHYCGTQEQWEKIVIDEIDNVQLLNNVHMESIIFNTAVEPSCTENGYAEGYKCALCDYSTEEFYTIAPLGHDYSNEWTIDKEATCTEDGSKSRHCGRCESKTDVTVIEAEGHTEEAIPAVPATCTSTGLTEGTKCSVCGEILVDQTVTEMLSHSMGEWITTQAPTCTETGEEKRECANCDYYETNILSATGHTEEAIPAVSATCTSTGLTEGTKCTACGETLVEQTVTEKLSHSYKTVVTKATCTTGGYTTYTCTVCGDSYIGDEMPTLGHKMGEFTVIKMPTCTENGEEISKCSRCDYSETQEISATSHNYENGVCSDCGDSKTENCSCNCHKSGFMGFVWQILNFFYKIFGTNKFCDCGASHY